MPVSDTFKNPKLIHSLRYEICLHEITDINLTLTVHAYKTLRHTMHFTLSESLYTLKRNQSGLGAPLTRNNFQLYMVLPYCVHCALDPQSNVDRKNIATKLCTLILGHDQHGLSTYCYYYLHEKWVPIHRTDCENKREHISTHHDWGVMMQKFGELNKIATVCGIFAW